MSLKILSYRYLRFIFWMGCALLSHRMQADVSVKKTNHEGREWWTLRRDGTERHLFPSYDHYPDSCTVLKSADEARLVIIHWINRREARMFLADKRANDVPVELKSDWIELALNTRFAMAAIQIHSTANESEFGWIHILLNDDVNDPEAYLEMQFRLNLWGESSDLSVSKMQRYTSGAQWIEAHSKDSGWLFLKQ